jgi:ribosomal protein S18 acetylase RimI-like enzyme
MDVDGNLAHRIEGQQAAHQAALTTVLHDRFAIGTAQSLPILGGYAIFQGHGYPTNHGQGMGFQSLVEVSELEHLEAFYAAQGATAAIELCPLANASFVAALGLRSYVIQRFYNTYLCALQPHEFFGQIASEIAIHQANEGESEMWAQTVAGTTSPDDPVLILAKATFFTPGVRCFLASIQGEIAGGGALAIMEDTAYLTFMGTRPAFRQRGVQNALIDARLAAAAMAGCSFAICNTNPGNQSQRNVLRHGFSLVYTKVFLRKASI